jgi:HK97 family phage major capsid protein
MELKEFEATLKTWQGEIQTQVNNLLKESGEKAETAKKALESELDTIKKSLNSVGEQLKAIEARKTPGLADELKKKPFDLGCLVQAMTKEYKRVPVEEAWKGAEWERECITASLQQRKDNNASTGADGGILIPDEVSNTFIDMVTQAMPLFDLGMNVVKGLVGDLPVPKKTQRTSAYMVGENEKPAGSSVKYGEVKLTPHKAAAFSKQSNRLIYQSRGVSDKIIRDDLAYSMAKLMHEQALSGTGTGKQTKGLFNHTGFTPSSATTALGANGGRFKIDHAAQMVTDLECADEINNVGGKYGFLMHPRVKAGMRRERVIQYSGQAQADAQPILPMNLLMTDKVLSEQLGYKIASTTLVPSNNTKGTSTTCAKTVFGDWNLFWMGMWRDLIIKVSDQAGDGASGSAFMDDQMYIIMFQEFDTALMREACMVVTEGCETMEANW